jgi:hypothetical protein
MLKFEAGSGAAPPPPLVISGTPDYLSRFNAAGDNIRDSNVKASISGSLNTLHFYTPAGLDQLQFNFTLNQIDSYLFFRHKDTSGNNAYSNIGRLGGTNYYGFFVQGEGNSNSSFAGLIKDLTDGLPKLYFNDQVNNKEAFIYFDNTFKIYANSVTWSWPTSDGTAGQVLTTNGAGVLSFATAGGGGDMILAAVQTNSGAKTFLDQTLLFRNPANTFSYTIAAAAIGGNYTLTLPTLVGADTLIAGGIYNQFGNYNSFIAGTALGHTNVNGAGVTYRTTNGGADQLGLLSIGNVALGAGVQRLITAFDATEQGIIFAAGNSTRWIERAKINIGNLVNTDGSESGDLLFYTQAAGAAATQKFGITSGGNLTLFNPAGTFKYTITPGAIAADRILNIPVITATDTLAVLGLAQTFTGATTEFSNIVGIGGAAVAGVALAVEGTVNNTGKVNMATTSVYTSSLLSIGFNTTTKDNGLVELGDWNGESNGTHIEIDDSSAMTIGLYASNGISANNAIFAYANNAAAVAAIGAGKMYYTDVAGEYLIKLSH